MSGIDLSPDRNFIAIAGQQGKPFYIYDWHANKIVNKFNTGNWFAGSIVDYSTNGKYILLQQLFNIDFAPNKDREVDFEIIEAQSGRLVKSFEKYHSVIISDDESTAIALSGDEVSFWNLETGKKEKSFTVENASNAVAISPDGSSIAVSHHVSEEALMKVARFKKDKKSRKFIAKYRQMITVFNATTFEKKYTVDEFYDIIYRLEYSKEGEILFCLQIPHMAAQSGGKRQSYISTIDGVNGEPSRKGFTSEATYEPDFKLSDDGRLFGIVSNGMRNYVEVFIYDFATGKMLKRFELSCRLFEKSDGEFIRSDIRSSFVFLPDNKSVLLTMGDNFVLWDMEIEN